MMEYKNPSLVYLGITLALLWAVYFWRPFLSSMIMISKRENRTSHLFRISKLSLFILGAIGWGYLSYSFMQPRMSKSYSPSSRQVNDIILTVDVSRSMLAEDLHPNRLEVAKRKLREFAKLRVTDRIGLIIFSEKIFTLLPLSTDPELLDKVLADINIGYLGSGTNIGDALGLSVARAAESTTKNKVIILLTDGVSNVGTLTPMQAGQEAKKHGIKVYTIGLGSSKDAKIPVGKSVFGTQYQLIPGGSIDYKTLKDISDLTGGKFYPAQDEKALETILDEIQKLEKTEIKTETQIVYNELYYKYFLIGFLCLFITEAFKRIFLREVV
jgi:Ca-activated chloride channel family protein